MKQIIELPNRDGLKYWLSYIDENTWKFEGDENYFVGVSTDEETGEVRFVDPPGGYPIGLGCKILDKTIKEVIWNGDGIKFITD